MDHWRQLTLQLVRSLSVAPKKIKRYGSKPAPLQSIVKKLARRSTKTSKPQFDLHLFRECVKRGDLRQCEQIYTSSEESLQGNCEMIGTYLKYGMYLKAQSINTPIECAEILNLWIQYWVEFGQPSKAEALLEQFKHLSNADSYLPFIKDALDKGFIQRAEDIQKGMTKKSIRVPNSFNEIIIGDNCKKRLNVNSISNPSHSIHIYRCLIEAHAFENNHVMIENIRTMMRQMDVPFDLECYNSMLLGMAHYITETEIETLLLELLSQGYSPNSKTHYAVIMSMILQSKFDKAMTMFNELSHSGHILEPEHIIGLLSKSIELDFDCLARLLMSLVKEHKIAMPVKYYRLCVKKAILDLKFSKTEGILRHMQANGVYPDMYFIDEIIDHCVTVVDLHRVKRILAEMKEHRLLITPLIKNSLSKTFHMCIRDEEGSFIIRGYPVDASGKKLIRLNGTEVIEWKRDLGNDLSISALKLIFEGIWNTPIYVGTNLFNDLLITMLKVYRVHDFDRVLSEMRSHQVIPNLSTLTLTIKAHLCARDDVRAVGALEEFKCYGLWPTIIHCALIHHHYCRIRDTEKAENWMNIVRTKYGIKPNLVFYGALIFAYYRMRNFKAVFAVVDKINASGLSLDTESSNYVLNSYFESGMYKQGVDFFRESYTGDRSKNLYSYAILANHLMHRADYNSFYECISDAALPRNEITFHTFEPVLEQADRENLPEEIGKAIKTMVNLTIRFHPSIMHYIRRTFQRSLQCSNEIVYNIDGVSLSGTQFARCLLEKSMIEISDQNTELLHMLDILLEHYRITSNSTESQSLRQFVQARLPMLKRLWTELREEYLASIKLIEQVNKENMADIFWEDDGTVLMDPKEKFGLTSIGSTSEFEINN